MPYAAPKPCPRHPEVILQRKEKCPKCPEKQPHGWKPDRERGTATERGYNYGWQKIRKQVLARDPYCRLCRREVSTDVDHKVSKANGGTDDISNLQGVCRECHKNKTIKDRSKKVEFNEKGIPLDPSHHWN